MTARNIEVNASPLMAALLGCTMLAGLPVAAAAQTAPAAQAQPQAAPAPGAAAPQASAAAVPEGEVIRSIAVAGAQRLEPETILSYIKLRPGDRYSPAAADQALKDLAATELFSDYRLENTGGNLVITVVENPVINRIVLEGNRRIKDDKILPEIQLSPRQIFTRSKVRADVARIIELYKRQGRFAATVEPQMVQLDQNRVDVVFEITEGPKSKVREINIIGNEAFSDGDLRDEMVTKVAGITRIFSSGTSYDPDRLAFDQQQLRAFYLENGYADFRVVSAVAELTPDRRDFIITYVVEEGQRYKFGEVGVDSQLRDFDSDRMSANLPMKTGDWYDAKLVEDTIEQMSELAGTYGYAFADVRPQFTRNQEDLTMNVRFVINEAPRVYVEQVNINGNTLTQDKVVRREFRITEGDAFNSLQVQRSTARINSLGYFQENFEVSQVDGSASDRIILDANVQEQATGELSLSAGFSSIESFIFQGSIRQRNFRGRGQTVGLSASYSRYSRSGQISFSEPYLFDKNISAGIDIYRRDFNNGFLDRTAATYEQAQTGISFRAGVPLTEYMTAIARYTFNYDNVTLDQDQYFIDGACSPLIAGRFLCDAIGRRTSSILGGSLIYSTLNNRVRPTRGENVVLNVDVAGLGGSVKYARVTANADKYWNIGSGFIFNLSGQGGYIKGLGNNGNVLLTDRFFLGEPQIRGFRIRGVGPRVIRRFYENDPARADGYARDANGDGILLPLRDRRNSDDALGGNAMYLFQAELEIPLGSGARELGLRPSIFVDAGAVFNVRRPQLTSTPFPAGQAIPARDANGNQLYSQLVYNDAGQATGTTAVINPTSPLGVANEPINRFTLPPFVEQFYGDSPKPRVAIGIGVNWNSPFGPFRINAAYPLLKVEGDDTRIFSFNVGTQF